MLKKLQGLSVGETYTQLLHIGTPNLSGNAIYTGDGAITSPFSLLSTGLDVKQAGVIRRDLTIAAILTGAVFPGSGSVYSPNCGCVFGCSSYITSGTQSYVVGGSANTLAGACNSVAINSYNVGLSVGRSLGAYGTFNSVISVQDAASGEGSATFGGDELFLGGGASMLIGGSANRVDGGISVTIVSGISNRAVSGICGNSSAHIMGGFGNYICSSNTSSTIGSGCSNKMIRGTSSIISTGIGNSLVSNSTCSNGSFTCSIIHTGQCNMLCLPVASDSLGMNCGTIFTGQCNKIISHLGYSHSFLSVYNGYNNVLSGSDITAIVNGCNNYHRSVGAPSKLYNGEGNVLYGGVCTTAQMHLLNGQNVHLSAFGGNIGNGMGFTGSGNIINSSLNCYKSIYTGQDNYVENGTIFSGCGNYSVASETHVFGGRNNRVGEVGDTGNTEAIIYGGQNNCTGISYGTSILGGKCNIISRHASGCLSARYSQIMSGEDNYMLGCCHNKYIFGGYQNYIDSTTVCGSFIIGGRSNRTSFTCTVVVGSCLSAVKSDSNIVNNLIVTDLPVQDTTAGLASKQWYRCTTDDIVRIVP
jgi:hypothetical protein